MRALLDLSSEPGPRPPFPWPSWGNDFLVALSQTGNPTEAATAVGVALATARRYRTGDGNHGPAPGFADDWDQAVRDAADRIFHVARKKALDGDNEMIRFVLGSLDPDRFAPTRRQVVSGPGGQPIQKETYLVTDRVRERLISRIVPELGEARSGRHRALPPGPETLDGDVGGEEQP